MTVVRPKEPLGLLLIGLAAMAAGLVNALAGGGTLITFPMLTAVGVPAIAANVTNTVALCPGYLGATLAQSKDLRGQRRRLWLVVPAGVIGGVLGGLLLLHTGERVFRAARPVPDPARVGAARRPGARARMAAAPHRSSAARRPTPGGRPRSRRGSRSRSARPPSTAATSAPG